MGGIENVKCHDAGLDLTTPTRVHQQAVFPGTPPVAISPGLWIGFVDHVEEFSQSQQFAF